MLLVYNRPTVLNLFLHFLYEALPIPSAHAILVLHWLFFYFVVLYVYRLLLGRYIVNYRPYYISGHFSHSKW